MKLLCLAIYLVVSTASPMAACPSSTRTVSQCAPCKASDGCTVLAKTDATGADSCCAQCAAMQQCEHWTYNPQQNPTSCHLKSGPQVLSTDKECVSALPGPTPPPTPQPQPDPNKHNILFLMCDSMDGRVLDPTSVVSKRVDMPNLRALAAQGTNFVRTYAASPQCVPSRTTMFTGRHTHSIKAWSNSQGLAGVPRKDWTTKGGLDPTCVGHYGQEKCSEMAQSQNVSATILESMRDNGYEPHLFGKVDVGAGILTDWDEANATCDGYHGGPILTISARAADVRRPTKSRPKANEKDNNVHPEDWKMVPKCVEFLQNIAAGVPLREQFGRQSPSKYVNWMLYCSINIPHPAFQTNATWLKYVHDDLVKPPVWQDEGSMHPYDTFMSTSKSVNAAQNFTEDEIVQVRRTYYAMCAETDYLLGRVLDALKATGQYANTYIIFLSDHGEMNMAHRQQLKNSMYEPSERVPMMIAGPGISRGATITNLTSLLDVFPTLIEMTGGSPPAFLQGQSLFPLMAPSTAAAPESYPVDRAVAAQYHSNMGNTGSYMVRWRNWKYIAFGSTFDTFSAANGYTAQLFDIAADPQEMHDVAALPANAKVVQQLDALLRHELGDYDAIDLEVMKNDKAIYEQYFVQAMSPDQLLQKFKASFKGFDDTDMLKVQKWHNTTI